MSGEVGDARKRMAALDRHHNEVCIPDGGMCKCPEPVVQRQALSAADRDLIRVKVALAESDGADPVIAAVERMLARHVTAALNEAATVLLAKTEAHYLEPDRCLCDVCFAFLECAAIVRALAANQP